jgi:hypothetical protein
MVRAFAAVLLITVAAAAEEPFVLGGTCRKIDAAAGRMPKGEFFDIEVVPSKTPLLTTLEPCPEAARKALADFASDSARSKAGLTPEEEALWDRALGPVFGLKPLQCALLTEPGSTSRLALMTFGVNAVRRKGVTGASLLVLAKASADGSPVKLLSQHLSVDGDAPRSVGVRYLCDLDGDKKAEVVLLGETKTARALTILRFAPGYASAASETAPAPPAE